jgi:beta-aspartyl-peptidase (threonine type)
MSEDLEAAYRTCLADSLGAGHRALAGGGSAEDSVVEAIRVMEDSPLFNAGRGSNLDWRGVASMDASIMRGPDLGAGAVSAVTDVRSPIDLARRVMEDCPHVFLSGEGAEAFAREMGIESSPNEWFVTPRRLEALEAARAREAEGDATPNTVSRPPDVPAAEGKGNGRDDVGRPDVAGTGGAGDPLTPEDFAGTVGAVALDREGRIVAGTSTGGMANKKWGRIGDSPVIGSGTYASTRCGVSCTGWGEYFIRNAVAHDIDARMEYLGVSLAEAARQVIHDKLESQLTGLGGIVALDAEGHVELAWNTAGMYRGWVGPGGVPEVGIY